MTKLCLLELTRDQAEMLSLLEAPTAAVIASIALETVGGHLRNELHSSETDEEPIRIIVSDFYLDWVLIILEVYNRPPYMEVGQYKIEDLRELDTHLRRMNDLYGNIPFPERILFSGDDTKRSGGA